MRLDLRGLRRGVFVRLGLNFRRAMRPFRRDEFLGWLDRRAVKEQIP